MRYCYILFIILSCVGIQLFGQTESRYLISIADINFRDSSESFTGTFKSNRVHGTRIDSTHFNIVVIYKSGALDSGQYRLIGPDYSFIPDGNSFQYYSSGNIHIKGTFKNGNQDSTWNYYYENGNLYLSETYFQDRLHGPTSSYYENGKIKSEGNYFHGIKYGVWSLYYENGFLKSRGSFVAISSEEQFNIPVPGDELKNHLFNEQSFNQEFKDGKWNYFSPKGKLVRREYYNRGVIKKIIFYD